RHWDLTAGRWRSHVKLKDSATWYDFSPDGQILAVSNRVGRVATRFVDTSSGTELFTFRDDAGHPEEIHGCFTPDGRQWLSASAVPGHRRVVIQRVDLAERRSIGRVEIPERSWNVLAT